MLAGLQPLLQRRAALVASGHVGCFSAPKARRLLQGKALLSVQLLAEKEYRIAEKAKLSVEVVRC